jgi:hypothetical protein
MIPGFRGYGQIGAAWITSDMYVPLNNEASVKFGRHLRLILATHVWYALLVSHQSLPRTCNCGAAPLFDVCANLL